MDIFDGLEAQERAFLQRGSSTRALGRGEVLFKEDDPAYGLFVIIEGQVVIDRDTDDGPVELARLGEGDVFGEMGLVRPSARRSANARTDEGAKVLELPGHPVEMLSRIPDKKLAVRFLQNLVCVLAARLRLKDAADARKVKPAHKGPTAHIGVLRELNEMEAAPEKLFAAVDASMPTGLMSRFFRDSKLANGETLCCEGDKPDGFYVLRRGSLDVFVTDETGLRRQVNTLNAPVTAGEVGYFANEKRSATLVAKEPVVLTHFSAKDFEKLKKDKPEDALRILHAASQLIACLILLKETEATAA